jgi:hypothetical protein
MKGDEVLRAALVLQICKYTEQSETQVLTLLLFRNKIM